MKKEFSEMTLEELWNLFLSDYRILRISHIGSTAIQGIWAKNIIDILVEIEADEQIEAVTGDIECNGFIRMSSDADRVSFNRGYTEHGFEEKVYHLHLRRAGDNDELYFRDYLNEHPQTAKEYEQLKLDLWKRFEHNRDGYTEAKSDFIRKWTLEAKKAYRNKY